MARGFIPVGLRSGPCFSSHPASNGLRRLRRRTGINPLATTPSSHLTSPQLLKQLGVAGWFLRPCAQLLLQILDLRLKGVDGAGDLATEGVEFGGIGPA